MSDLVAVIRQDGPVVIKVGENTAAAAASATSAAESAALAQAAANQNTAPDIASGLAITSGSGASDRFFTVKHSGPAEYREYRNDAGVATDFPQRRDNQRRRDFGEPTVMVLPPPELATGRYMIWKQSPAVRVYSDGSKWWNTTVSPWTEIEAWWAPARCEAHIDRENARYYWGGQVRDVSELTAVGNGFILNDGLNVTDEITVRFEYRHDHSQTVSGSILSWWKSTGGVRWEFSALNISADRKYWNFYGPKDTSGADFIQPNMLSKTNEGGTYDGRGRQRFSARFSQGSAIETRNGPGELQSKLFGDGAGLAVSAPTRFGFGARAFDQGFALTNSEFFNGTVWSETLTDDEMYEVNAPLHVPRIHLLGDSFLNLYKVFDAVRLGLEAEIDQYYAISQDGVGGTDEQQQAIRFATDFDKWHEHTLVFLNGGRDYQVDPGSVAGRNAYIDAGLHSVLNTLPHDRWVLTEAAPNTNDGTTARTEWNATEAHVRNICGPHWVETLAPIQALSNGGTDDENYVNNLDLWPLSLRTSAGDFHPNAAGCTALGGIVADALIARGYHIAPSILPLTV
ncbi:hypothetical protein INR77_08805 [Erythrobacter sp. SCSIO 43205]|uniref:hypothetical protein n=1 Tax=Erythrobacter sp. SCSIO 43205 TaxID=2779361 RepID=UPI001CA9CE18|nr:hypothetical protein [Erythrobacter sp. SCSIO 43205]UAB76946.1 hypothetical protein INR77_08805 [Erythrobacter sp. SCSIO 43205]